MRYHDFDLWIEPSPAGGLLLRSSCTEHGENRDETTIDFAAVQLAEQTMLGSAVATQAVIDVGRQLYGTAFASAKRRMEWHFGQCCGLSPRRENGVRVRLRMEDPRIASIPWEFLYSEHLQFLGVSTQTPVVRYLELGRPIGLLEAALPVRMLVVIPRVKDLDTAVERRQLVETLAPLGEIVSLKILEGSVTRQDIADALLEQSFHILHFIGHGDFAGNDAVLAVNRADGGTDLVSHTTLAGMLRNHPTMKLIVLNSCRGGTLSKTKPLVGMAAALVKEGIPAVIAMQYDVEDREAITFARTFYRALFTGDDRGRIEIALSHARNALFTEYPDTWALGIPVLFTHAREGVLFELGAEKPSPDRPLSVKALHSDQAALATHDRNVELLRAEPAGSPAREVDLANEERARSKTARRIRRRYATIAGVLGAVLVVSLLMLAFGFQRLPQRARVESYAVWLTDLLDKSSLDSSLAIVSLDSVTEAKLGPLDSAHRPEWRRRHAMLIDRLAAAGAKTIAFNFFFDLMTPLDDSLAASIRRARAGNTEVVIGVNGFDRGQPSLVPSLAAAALWGHACLGDKKVHSLKMMPLLIASGSPGKPARVPSLPLQAVAAHLRGSVDDRLPLSEGIRISGQTKPILLSELLIASPGDTACASISGGDTLAEIYVKYSPVDELRARERRLSYASVLGNATLAARLKDKLVIVGREVNDTSMIFKVARLGGIEERTSVEILTDAINSILTGSSIRPLGQWGQFIFILLMAIFGAAAATLATRNVTRLAFLVAAFIGYVVTAMWFYSAHHLLLNTVFHLISLLIAFRAVVLIRRRWFA